VRYLAWTHKIAEAQPAAQIWISPMSLSVIKPERVAAAEDVVKMLERMLDLARSGHIQHCIVVGIEETNLTTHRGLSHYFDVTLIGAVSVTLAEMQREYSDTADRSNDPPDLSA
jgi:hypothetical protein